MLLYGTLIEFVGNHKKSVSERGLLQKITEVRGRRGHRRRGRSKIQYTHVWNVSVKPSLCIIKIC